MQGDALRRRMLKPLAGLGAAIVPRVRHTKRHLPGSY